MALLRGVFRLLRGIDGRWLFLVPIAGIIFPPWYARNNPRVLGMPFVVWYQFVLVIAGLLVTAIVFVTTDARHSQPEPDDAGTTSTKD